MGGRPWLARDGGREFVETLLRDHKPEIKLALCIFAQPESDWSETERINTEMIMRFANDAKVDVRVMTPDNLEQLSHWADVVYLPGGHTETLKKRLHPFDIARLWNGKTIAGSSAGAHLLCVKSVYLQDRTIVEGMGWVRASVVVHWRANDFAGFTKDDWDWAEQTLIDPTLPMICLPEDKFVEITVA